MSNESLDIVLIINKSSIRILLRIHKVSRADTVVLNRGRDNLIVINYTNGIHDIFL